MLAIVTVSLSYTVTISKLVQKRYFEIFVLFLSNSAEFNLQMQQNSD